MIEQWLSQYAPNAPYLVIFGVLLATGFGLPLPEDIPLIIGGYLCGQTAGHPTLWIMLPGCMIAIVGSDIVLYYLGIWIGPSIHRHPILKRIVGNRNLARARFMFKRHDAKFVFFARFLPASAPPRSSPPGLSRCPSSGSCSGTAPPRCSARPGRSCWGYFFHEQVDYAREALSKGKTVGFVIIGVLIVVFVGFHFFVNKKFEKAVPDDKQGVGNRE